MALQRGHGEDRRRIARKEREGNIVHHVLQYRQRRKMSFEVDVTARSEEGLDSPNSNEFRCLVLSPNEERAIHPSDESILVGDDISDWCVVEQRVGGRHRRRQRHPAVRAIIRPIPPSRRIRALPTYATLNRSPRPLRSISRETIEDGFVMIKRRWA